MKRNLIIGSVILVCVIGALILFKTFAPSGQAPDASQKKKKPAPLVQVEPARLEPIARTLELTGEVVATRRVTITALKDGPIAFCPWREGDGVEAGETLVRIERETLRAEALSAQASLQTAQAKLDDLQSGARPEEIQRAEANLKRSEAVLAEAGRQYERQAELIKTSVASQQAVDKAREQLDVAEADATAARQTLEILKSGPTATEIAVQKAAVGEAEARLTLARAHLAECEMVSPFDGIVSQVHVRPGDMASVRAPLLEMFAPDSLVVRFAVPEAQAASVRKGMTLRVALDARPDADFDAHIIRVYPDLHPLMRTRRIEAAIDDPAGIAPNMFGRIVLTLDRVEQALVVPSEAVVVSPTGQRTLFVIHDGKAHRRVVTIGIEDGKRAQVLSGLEAGEKVAVAGAETLKPDTPVRIASANKPKDKKPGAQKASGQTGGQSE